MLIHFVYVYAAERKEGENLSLEGSYKSDLEPKHVSFTLESIFYVAEILPLNFYLLIFYWFASDVGFRPEPGLFDLFFRLFWT